MTPHLIEKAINSMPITEVLQNLDAAIRDGKRSNENVGSFLLEAYPSIRQYIRDLERKAEAGAALYKDVEFNCDRGFLDVALAVYRKAVKES